jgi:ribonucleoside-diphosphate reductase alpha chain
MSDGAGRGLLPRMGQAKHTAHRRRLPQDRQGFVHKFSIAGFSGFLRTGEYDDGRLGEIFIEMSKEGSTLSGLLDALSTAVSVGLQYGVPLEVFADKFVGGQFEPSGIAVGSPDIERASSVLDYVFRVLVARYGTPAKGGAA